MINLSRLKNRGVSRVGEVHGPYIVDRPVGADPVTSEWFVLRCALGCGHEVKAPRRQFRQIEKQKGCGGCGVAKQAAE